MKENTVNESVTVRQITKGHGEILLNRKKEAFETKIKEVKRTNTSGKKSRQLKTSKANKTCFDQINSEIVERKVNL
jgi:hypothetical protein